MRMEQKVKEIIEQYNGDKSYLVPILQDVQREFNYLPKEALCAVSANLDVPISRVYEVVTFYKAFSLKPRGATKLSLCMGTACHVRGTELIARNIVDILGIKEGDTTADLEFLLRDGRLPRGLRPRAGPRGQRRVPWAYEHCQINKILKTLGKKGATDDDQD